MAKIVSKLVGRTFQPKRLLGKGDDVRALELGTLLVIATAVSRGTNDDGEIYTGFLGTFEYTDAIDGTVVASGKLYLPDAITQLILEPLEGMTEEQKKGGPRAMVRAILRVGVQRAGNPAGYEWTFEPVGDIGTADPLADLRKALPPPPTPQIEDATAPKSKAK